MMTTDNRLMASAPELLRQFDGELARFFQAQRERYDYGEMFEPIYHHLAEFVMRRAKRVRPVLFVHAYRTFGSGTALEGAALWHGAIALELLHAFVLVHDDVIDRSETRRGLPTFHKLMEEQTSKWSDRERLGQNLAIVAGDMLFALAVDTLAAAEFDERRRHIALRKFLQYITDTGCGESLDILLGARDVSRVTTREIEQMYDLKTTRYTFEAPLVLGALLAGAETAVTLDLAAVAQPLGLAFQMQNDLNEFSHFDPADRALQTDLIEGKKTLLVRLAYERLGEVDRSFLQLCLQATTVRETSILKVKELIERSGAVDAMREMQGQLMAQADAVLDRSSLTPSQREGVRDMMSFVRQMLQKNGS